MNDTVKDALVGEVEHLIHEVDALLRAAVGHAGEEMHDASEQTQKVLGEAREKLVKLESELEKDIRARARRADHYVHDKPWIAISATAVVAFLLGFLSSHRDG